MDCSTLASAIEAVLFTMGEAVERERLMAAFEVSEEEIEQAITLLRERYNAPGSGLKLLILEDSLQLCTGEEMFPYLVKVVKQPKRQNITEAVLETLSIIAYKQPVTKLEMEKIRGVSCEHSVSRLMELGLIEEAGRLEAPGRPILFKTSMEFLRAFGLESIEDLPEIDPELMERFRAEAEEMVPGAPAEPAKETAEGSQVDTDDAESGKSAENTGDDDQEPFMLGDTVMTIEEDSED